MDAASEQIEDCWTFTLHCIARSENSERVLFVCRAEISSFRIYKKSEDFLHSIELPNYLLSIIICSLTVGTDSVLRLWYLS